MKNSRFLYKLFFLFCFISGICSCTKNYNNPNAATESQVLSSVNGLTGVATNLQYIFSADGGLIFSTISSSSLLTTELAVVNAGNTDEQQLEDGGGAVQNTNGLLTGMWTNANKVIYDADNVIGHTGIVSDKAYASGLIAYSSIFKAMAIGDMAMFWDHVPDTIGANVGFISSNDGYKKALTVIDNALAVIQANPISASFLTNIPSGIDIPNTLYALKARYSLFAGNYADALASANQVDLSVLSVFNFSNVNLNPIFSSATSTNNLYQPADYNFGLPSGLTPDPNDRRIPFYIVPLTSSATGLGINGFFSSSTGQIPVYLPGEMILIKAEAYARGNDLSNGLKQLNIIVTKTAALDPYGVGADLSPIAGPLSQNDLLDQIYRNRSIELYMSGFHLEDERRFGRPQTERKRNYFPFPFVERNGNSNTPDDPAF